MEQFAGSGATDLGSAPWWKQGSFVCVCVQV